MKNILTLSSLLVVLAACGTQGNPSDDVSRPAAADAASSEVNVWLPAFTAQTLPRPRPGLPVDCQFGVDVELNLVSERLNGAILTDRVEGQCEILVHPNKRFYELALVADDCGSKIYEGHLVEAKGQARLRVIDNSHRVCDDKRPGMIELEEVSAKGRKQRFAGDW